MALSMVLIPFLAERICVTSSPNPGSLSALFPEQELLEPEGGGGGRTTS